ncbi:von Willebrand factor type A domain protein [Methyloversatilis sp. RAC08]|uniref:VWA domain-containing protein n=1 Tax=Methyloversatilis sp. RAC08 TaxID=1842540 RepID=UPI00083CE421|nr:VWA domain-containing protein [Methyloversatilis sp. RAC08]AOF83260.1 von Willebrand factor type A domain protein [Methyloversatilis sp. RAC08]
MSADPQRLFAAREARLAALEALPRTLWLSGLTHAQGILEPRLAALVALRDALIDGRVPASDAWGWPSPDIVAALCDTFRTLDLAAYCSARRELTDTVLLSLLFHLDFIDDYRDRGATAARAIRMAVEAFESDWQDRRGQMDELIDVFGKLPDDGKNARWDLIPGLLRSEGWREVVRIRRLLERLPELARCIRRLGRAQPADEIDAAQRDPVTVLEDAIARRTESRSVRVPDMPGETRGIHRADRIARMLPAEAVLLGHPVLRLVWHARRAERTLLCYEDDDRLHEVHQLDAPVLQARPDLQADRRLEMGPLLVCVDTSGSMQGGAGQVAKAVVLEAVRTAHDQGRACHVFAFGGPDEVVELDVAVDASGIERLIHFLGQGFRGGTDICGPLDRALARLEQQAWQRADLLIASDGEFGATPELVARLDAAKAALGLRAQGVLIGDRETIGLLEVADDIHPVRDWRRYGDDAHAHGSGDSPLHTHRLTALYFPGALRTPENRDATVSGEAASSAVRAGLRRDQVQPGSIQKPDPADTP